MNKIIRNLRMTACCVLAAAAVLIAAIVVMLYIIWAFRAVPKAYRYAIAAVVALANPSRTRSVYVPGPNPRIVA